MNEHDRLASRDVPTPLSASTGSAEPGRLSTHTKGIPAPDLEHPRPPIRKPGPSPHALVAGH